VTLSASVAAVNVDILNPWPKRAFVRILNQFGPALREQKGVPQPAFLKYSSDLSAVTRRPAPRIGLPPDDPAIVLCSISDPGQSKLFKIAKADYPASLFFGAVENGKKQRQQNRNHSDHNQKLD
jgi:hypothetical protein